MNGLRLKLPDFRQTRTLGKGVPLIFKFYQLSHYLSSANQE